ncbi:MAG: plastocyanin/azurin family copper-binding protein [Halanaeroarchaeum sp.]
MVDTSFDPVRTALATGGTVTWKNEDQFGHDVTARMLTDAGAEWAFSSGTIGAGETTQYTFEEAGAYEYLCTIHGPDTMCGVILVGEPQYDATLPCEGDGNPGGGVY